MEVFEAIRQSALRLHQKLRSAGADAFQPLALIEAAVKDLDLELTWLPAGHPALKGARGLFDQQSGTVACEDAKDAGDRAQLAGHEIGHAVIHSTSTSCTTSDIDPSRSTEMAPVGLQRVEDYGAHERRELQANVFAREFLLPRPLAVRLHIDEGLGATAIADKTGLPKNLIRQQLFDALLLPTPPETVKSDPRDALVEDKSQDRAAAHRGSAFQLQAGPGTGKTRTLEKRVQSLLDEGVDPAAILILTFSNRAAGELSERLVSSTPEAADRIWMGTFHAFGLDLLRRYHQMVGLPADPILFDRSDAIEILEDVLPTLPIVHFRNLWDPAMVLREIVAAISRAKDEMTGPDAYRQLAQAMLDGAKDEKTRIAAEKCLEVAIVYQLYEQALTERQAVDFGDLIMKPVLLLESDANLRKSLQLRHRHVLVDEYQDVNRASARLLKALADDGKRLWVVGDSRQSIYRFRGASSTNMTAFMVEYKGSNADQLAVNYRSTKQIVDALVAIAPRMGASVGMLPLQFTASRGPGPVRAEIRRYPTVEDEAAGLAASIRDMEKAGVPLRNQAVLCRGNRRLAEIAEALEERGIPVLHLGSLFERDEIRDLLALLSLAVDHFGEGFVRVGAMPRYGLSLQDVYIATQYLNKSDGRALESLSNLATITGLSSKGINGLSLLAQDLEGLGASTSAWEFLAHYLLEGSSFIRDLYGRKSVQDQMRAVALWQFLNFVRERSPTGAGFPIQRTLDRVRQLVLLAEERDLRQVPAAALHMDAVRLMTVHGSKGLEFEAVHVPGLTVSSFPLSNRGQRCPPPQGMIEGAESMTVWEHAEQSQDYEEECLFFVAYSRARTHLRFYLSQFQANGNKRTPSPFLDWIPASLITEVSSPTTLPLPAGTRLTDSNIMVSYTVPPEATPSQLMAYEKCPRRFFYTHVLGLRNARKPTPFTRAHDCIYELIEWLAQARNTGEPTLSDAEAAFDAIWADKGPTSPAAAEYRSLASRLIASLINAGAGRKFRASELLAIDLPNGRVIVKPDEISQLPNGAVILRRVQTGRKRSDEYDRLDYTLYHLAGETHFSSGFTVEALHLTDGTSEPVPITAKKLGNRRSLSDAILKEIAAGNFPPKIDAVTCPRCPHFFVCPAVAAGPLTKN
jgi:DNA helicase-2/ATP-dependent DNA helicase PcrA